MDEIITALKKDQSDITQTDYSRIIDELKELGYTGRPERWHNSKDKVKNVLPEKIEWFRDNPDRHAATPDQIRAALEKGKVYV